MSLIVFDRALNFVLSRHLPSRTFLGHLWCFARYNVRQLPRKLYILRLMFSRYIGMRMYEILYWYFVLLLTFSKVIFVFWPNIISYVEVRFFWLRYPLRDNLNTLCYSVWCLGCELIKNNNYHNHNYYICSLVTYNTFL